MCQSRLPVMYIPTSWFAQITAQYVCTDTFRISLAIHPHGEGCLDELAFEHKWTAAVSKHKTRTVAEAESDVHVEQQHVHTNFEMQISFPRSRLPASVEFFNKASMCEMQIIRRHAWRMRLVKDFWRQHITVFVVFHWSIKKLQRFIFGIRSSVVGFVGSRMTVLRR
jgi:hypothetical protein